MIGSGLGRLFPASAGPMAQGPGLGGMFAGLGLPGQGTSAQSVPGNSPMVPPAQAQPQSQEYAAVTQSDGTVLLHIRMPDGSMGPVVKIVNPPKPRAPVSPVVPAI